MKKLGNYIMGRWIEGDGDLQILADAVTGCPFIRPGRGALIFTIYSNMQEQMGNPALRKMIFMKGAEC